MNHLSVIPLSWRLALLALSLTSSLGVHARKWNNTGKGTIVFEEAWTTPELVNSITAIAPVGQTLAELKANLLDIHNQRLERMDATGIDYMVLSCANPCIQGITDASAAEAMAINVNNQLAQAISNNTMRFGGFASLAMHNATVASQELRRAVKELGFLGALINDYQVADNQTLLFYDQPVYDEFWQTVQDLNVPVYLHPRSNVAPLSEAYLHAPWLKGPAQEFAATLSTHVLGLCTNGVFDRFPKVKVIIGHLGERISSDLFRIDEQLKRQIPQGMPMQLTVASYYHTNIFETSSGNFDTDLLNFHISKIGLDRILYSIDYPFVTIEEGQEWVASLKKVMSTRNFNSLVRENAIKLLHLH